jgi:hypothetical protein
MSNHPNPVIRISRADIMGILKDALCAEGPHVHRVPISIEKDDDDCFMVALAPAADID